MRIEAVRVEGIRHHGTASIADLGELAQLPSGAAGGALVDAIDLAVAALAPTRCPAILRRLELSNAPEPTTSEALVDEVAGLDPDGVDAFTDDLPVRHVIVTLEAMPDPPLYRTLRSEAARDARVLAALVSDARITVRVGWLFNKAGTHASVSVLSFQVGDVVFNMGTERPSWLPSFLARVGARIELLDWQLDTDRLARELLDAMLSPDPSRRRRSDHASDSTEGPPFGFGRLHLVRRGERITPCFGPELITARTLGPAAMDAVRWAHAAIVRAPDVLVARLREAPGPDLLDWLTDRIHGPEASLEQLIWTGP